MLSFALVTALSSFSEPKLEVLGALAGVLEPIVFLAPLGIAKGGGCVDKGKLMWLELPKTDCAGRKTGGSKARSSGSITGSG